MRLREIGSVNPVLVGAAENGGDTDSCRDLLAESGSGTAGTSASVAVLVECDLVGARVAGGPFCPTLSIDDVGKSSVLENDASVVPPRTAEVVSTSSNGVTRSGRNLGLVDNKVGWVRGGVATAGGDVTKGSSKDANVNAVEPRYCLLSEYKIGTSSDLGLGVDLVTSLSEDGVLEAGERAAVVTLLVGVGTESESLGAGTATVDNVEVVHLHVGGPGPQSGGEVVDRGVILALALCDSHSVRRETTGIGGLSVDGEGGFQNRYIDLLLVCAFDEVSA